MNYESFCEEMQAHEKGVREIIAGQQKYFKRLSKNMEKGDVKNAAKDIDLLQSAGENYRAAINALLDAYNGFDAKAYMESGEYSEQLLDCLRQAGIDAKGEYGVYEVFPYKLKIDVENQDVYIDRRRVQCMRPQALALDIKLSKDKLMAASFNPLLFANELAGAYDMALLYKSGGKSYAKDADCYLTDLYKFLTPMRRFRRDYDLQSFAFDLARLSAATDVRQTDDGRGFQFGPSRNNKKAIRVLDGDGKERFLATVRFYKV